MQPTVIVDDSLTGWATFALAIITGVATLTGVSAYFAERSSRKEQRIAGISADRSEQAFNLVRLQQEFAHDRSALSVRREWYQGASSELVTALRARKALEGGLADDGTSENRTELNAHQLELLTDLDNYFDFLGLVEHLIEIGSMSERDAYSIFSWYITEGTDQPELVEELDNFPWAKSLRARFDCLYEQDEPKPKVTAERLEKCRKLPNHKCYSGVLAKALSAVSTEPSPSTAETASDPSGKT